MKNHWTIKTIFVCILGVASVVLPYTALVRNVTAQTTTITAASCEYTDVSAAVAAANPGDTVMVPACTATWTSGLLITQSIRLVGAGMDATTLINGIEDTGLGDFLIRITPDRPEDNPFVEVTGLTLDANNEGACISISSRDPGYAFRNFRIHHNRIKNTLDNVDQAAYMAVRVKGNCFGLIDNNQFENNAYDFKIYGNDRNSWETFSGLENIGTGNYLYIENNTSTHAGQFILTSGEGARWVYRYNTVFGKLSTDAHGDTRNRGVVAHEIYENVATNDFDPITGGGFSHDYRGGTGIIFNNSAQIGTSGTRGKIQVREEHETCTDSGGCDGSPGGDQVNNGYIWNNRNTRDNHIIAVWHEEFDPYDHIAEDTDWWDDASRSPGGESPTNFFYDVAANRPPTCQDDDCYWETDTRKLYRCVGVDNWQFIYTPYTYPHPLSQELSLHGTPANHAIRLDWEVNATLPATATWTINYESPGSVYLPVTGILSPTRSYALTDLTNGVWYTVTLHAMLDSTSWLSDTVQVMPTGRFVYLPLVLK